MTVRIPRSSRSRKEVTFAQLLLFVNQRPGGVAFQGKYLKCGTVIDEADLWPDEKYPAHPILLERAGSDYGGPRDYRYAGAPGHRVLNSIYILWRYDIEQHAWVELLRCHCRDGSWIETFKPIIIREIARDATPVDTMFAAAVSDRVLSVLDRELETLTDAQRGFVMNFVHEEFTARAVNYA